MPRSFLVKNKRCTSFNVHRSYEDEPKASISTGKTRANGLLTEYVKEAIYCPLQYDYFKAAAVFQTFA